METTMVLRGRPRDYRPISDLVDKHSGHINQQMWQYVYLYTVAGPKIHKILLLETAIHMLYGSAKIILY